MNTKPMPITLLALDQENYRTVPQPDETNAIHALIAIGTDRFFALVESLLDDGYLPTENIIVLNDGKTNVVMEGNRRIAALKIIHGYVNPKDFNLPPHLVSRIAKVDSQWKKSNLSVPCAIYSSSQSGLVDKIVSRTHGKGDKASKSPWESMAKARHGREKNGADEPGLDLVEKCLKTSKQISSSQAERWAGEFPLTVLDEALGKLAPRLGFKSARALSDSYPKDKTHKKAVELLIQDIGLELLTFNKIRSSENDFAIRYGAKALPSGSTGRSGADGGKPRGGKSGRSAKTSGKPGKSSTSSTSGGGAAASNDPRAVKASLKAFAPRGKDRGKLVALLNEMRKLKIKDHPHAFCFLLRSMYEISAKLYCTDHSKDPNAPKVTKSDGKDRPLVDVLNDVVSYMTNNNSNIAMVKTLHGAITQLAKPTGILSVTSMNQLVHNPKFSIQEHDICVLFGNIFPLLEEMNK